MKWFSIRGIQTEIKRIRWPHTDELLNNTKTVIVFTIAFGAFFVACNTISALFLKMIGA